MKKASYTSILLTFCIFAMFAGNAGEVLASTCKYSISPLTQSFDPNGHTGSFAVTTSLSSCSWIAITSDNWITITQGSGTGNGTVTYSVSTNNSGNPRKGMITFGGQTFTIRQAGSAFNDVAENHWAYSYIYSIFVEGITVGCGSGYYCPDSTVTRGQMAAFLIRSLYGENFSYTQTPYFSDVPSNHGFFKYVQKMKDDGITSVSGVYNVDSIVTRAQMAAFLARAFLDELPLAESPCSSDIPTEESAHGDYRCHSTSLPADIRDVSISERGWRAVAGVTDNKIYYFQRSQADPIFSYTTGDQVLSVRISRDGRAFVAGSMDGKIYFFECDRSTPVWIYDTNQDVHTGLPNEEVYGVDITPDGRWIAAVSETHAYLFRRDRGAVPVLKLDLYLSDSIFKLATVAISSDGAHLAVGSVADGTSAKVFYINRMGKVWTYTMPDDNVANYVATPVAISADGTVIVAGGADRNVHLWNNFSSTPLWTYTLSNESAVYSVSLSDDGTRLAITCYNELYFIGDTSRSPNFTGGTDWKFDGWITAEFSQPTVYPGHDTLPTPPTWLGISDARISADGSYIFASDYVYGYAYSFYRESNSPIRLYHLTNTVSSVDAIGLSPDGSWVMIGSGVGIPDEVVRVEVAPVEIIEVDFPLTFRADNQALNQLVQILGGDKFKIDYIILKPGRPAVLNEHWAIWASMVGGVLLPPISILCSGDKEWDFYQTLADGNQIIKGTHELTPPQCLGSDVTSIDFFFLKDELRDNQSGSALSYDYATLATVQIATGQ